MDQDSESCSAQSATSSSEPLRSHVDDFKSEWRNRKISIWGAARGVISQLRVGQDLTRVSLPSVFLYPFSLLEVGGFRMLCHIDYLADPMKLKKPRRTARAQDSQARLIAVLRWLLSVVEKEDFVKKPYNPVLGETLRCSVDLGGGAGRAEYIAEQVSHHPPIAMYVVRIPSVSMILRCHTSFGVKYNSVNVTTEGYMEVVMEKTGEIYRFSKPLPDLTVKNVVLGSRRINWVADMTLKCEQTKMHATLSFKDDSKNTVEGSIYRGDAEVGTFQGATGELIQIKVGGGKGEALVSHSGLKKLPIQYLQDQEATCSMKIWAASNRAIVDNDMDKADAAKTAVEVEQRRQRTEREQKNLPVVHQFFTYDAVRSD